MLLKSKNTILRTLLPFAVIALCGLFCCCNKAETSSETVIGTAETDISWERDGTVTYGTSVQALQ